MNIGVAQRPRHGETVCGDGCLVLRLDSGLLVMVSDGTGHGPPAAEASECAAQYVKEHEHLGLESMLRGCGDALRSTRGAAIALLRLNARARETTFASVGNVELRADCQHRVAPVCSPGVVGRPVRKILTFRYPLCEGDRFALFTDGLSRRTDLGAARGLAPQAAADRLLAEYGVMHDDATCVVVEYAEETG